MTKEQKKKLYRFGLPVILGTILLLGVSYAWLSLTLTGTKTNVLKAGTLSLVLNDTTGNGIDMSGAVPMLDEVGETQSPYTFTLTNNGDVESEYTIYLDDVSLESNETRLPDSVIKYNLVKDGSSSTALLSTLGSNPNRILDSGVIGPEESHSYELRLWLDENATNEIAGQVFRGQIRVEAEQIIEEAPLPSTDASCFVTSDLEDGTIQIDQYICGFSVEGQPNTNPITNIVNVVIPEQINDKTVSKVGDQSFAMIPIDSVIIPKTVNSIGAAAFLGNALTSITIPESVNSISPMAFSSNQLTSVVIKGKSSSVDFDYYGEDIWGWANGYSDANITWQP